MWDLNLFCINNSFSIKVCLKSFSDHFLTFITFLSYSSHLYRRRKVKLRLKKPKRDALTTCSATCTLSHTAAPNMLYFQYSHVREMIPFFKDAFC